MARTSASQSESEDCRHEMSIPESGSYSSQGLRRVQRISPQLDARGGSGRICPSLSEWKTLEGAIVAGSREALPASGDDLKAPKDYRLLVPPGRIVVCGFDERGAMYGLNNLEQRMNPREASFLPGGVDHVRSVTIFGHHVRAFPTEFLQSVHVRLD